MCVYVNVNEQFVFPFRVFMCGNTPKIENKLPFGSSNNGNQERCSVKHVHDGKNGNKTKTKTEIKRKEIGGKRHSSLIV